jgi:signal transduction histidine kinase
MSALHAGLARNAASNPEAALPVAERNVPRTILIVEDEPEILAPLSHSLQRAGYLVFEAEDGLSACRMIGSHHPDLILLDILLPDLNGWEVCRLLRQHPEPQIAATPVIMLTALNTPDDKLHGLQLGADAYLPKPYSQQEVLLLSGKLIERHRRQLDLESRYALLSDALEQQRELHSLMFHELRNQLTIISGYTELLGGDRTVDETGSVAAIRRSSSYLQNLAEDFLLVRKVQDGRLRLPVEPLCIEELLNEIIELYTPAGQARGILLLKRSEGDPRPVSANRPALKIILSALLDNAVKYGPANSPVILACDYQQRHCVLKVCDAGEGFAPQERERIFERFYRGTGQAPGSGFGLYGVRVLSLAMGGDAGVDETVGTGCCLRVNLPLAAVTGGATA